MADKKVILVFGATGTQGGSVVSSLLKDGKFDVHAVTRDPASSKAKALADRGVEPVKADQANPEETKAALKGVYGVYLVTNFWDPATGMKEQEYASRIVKEAKEAGVTHFIWSTLPDSEDISKGKLDVPHMAGKGKVDPVVASAGFKYYTFSVCPFYFQNFDGFGLAEEKPDGTMSFNMKIGSFDENSVLTGFDVTEVGPSVVGALNHPEKWGSGQRLNYGATSAPLKDYLATFTKVTGKPAEVHEWPAERTMFKEEFDAMFSFFNDYPFYGSDDPQSGAKAAGQPLSTWEQYLKKSGFGKK